MHLEAKLLGRDYVTYTTVKINAYVSKLPTQYFNSCALTLVMRIFGLVAQLVRAPPCHGGGRGFESLLGRSIER